MALHVFFKRPPGGVESIAQRQVNVFISLLVDDDLRAGNVQSQTDAEFVAPLSVAVRLIDRDVATHESGMKMLELGEPPAQMALQRLRVTDAEEHDLDRGLHACRVFRRTDSFG